MFYPFRKEADLMSAETGMYLDLLNEPSVITTINANKQIFEPFGDLVDSALRNLRNDLQNNTDSFAQQENDEVQHVLSVIFFGDLHHLPPTKAYPIYFPYESSYWENLIHKWKLFKIAELKEMMRQ